MYSDNKQIRDVADVAARIMYGQQPVTEKLHPNQQQLDVHEPEKDELTADDFKKLRAKKGGVVKEDDTGYQDRFAVKNGKAVKHNPEKGEHDEPHHVWADSPEHAVRKHAAMNKPKTEEVEELDELSKDTLGSYIKKANYAGGMADFKHGRIADRRGDSKEKTALAATSHKRTKGISTAVDKLSKEEVELDEVKMADLPSTKVQGRSYGSSKPEPHPLDVMKGPTEKQLLGVQAEKKKKKFSEMVNLYQEKGLKSLSEMLVKEEPDNEQFTKELEDAKAKSEGKKRNTEIAKGAVQAVKQEELDINDINGVQMFTIEERHMTDDEMEKREKIVKSMKKGMAGFKDRYGDRAKNVMYATANKQAMKD
jgi:hypothetical protein